MTHARKLAVALLGGLFAITAVAADKDGWTELLPEGQYKNHWATTGNWQTNDDGVLELKPREGEKGWSRWTAYLWSEKQYDDFEVTFDYKVQNGGNSGFYFNVGDKDDPVKQGVEVQIYASGNKKPGAKLTDHDSGGVISVKVCSTQNLVRRSSTNTSTAATQNQ